MNIQEVSSKFPYFYKLYLYNISVSKDNGLLFEDLNDISDIDQMLKSLYLVSGDLDSILYHLLTCCGQILGRQYFKDGNSRTLKLFIKDYLEELGYQLEFDYNDFIMPMLFEGEEATLNDIEKFKRLTNIRPLKAKKL